MNYLTFEYTYHSNVSTRLSIFSFAAGCSTFRIKRMTSSMRRERYGLLVETTGPRSYSRLLDRDGERIELNRSLKGDPLSNLLLRIARAHTMPSEKRLNCKCKCRYLRSRMCESREQCRRINSRIFFASFPTFLYFLRNHRQIRAFYPYYIPRTNGTVEETCSRSGSTRKHEVNDLSYVTLLFLTA